MKVLLLAGALVALAPIAAQATEPFKFEPEKARAGLMEGVYTECHLKAESQTIPQMVSPPLGPIAQRQMRQHWEGQCIAGGAMGVDELVDGLTIGSITRERVKFCFDNTKLTPEIIASLSTHPFAMRIYLCAKTGGIF